VKALKIAAIALAALLAAAGAALAYVALTFDPNRYKPQLVELVERELERKLVLEGDIGLSLWPDLVAQIGKASLSERGGEAEFASLERARVSLALLPLLRGEAVVNTVSVHGLRANIVRRRDGTLNLDDLLGARGGKPGELRFDIAAIALRDAALSYRDEASGARFALSQLEVETGRVRPGLPTRIEVSFRLRSERPAVELEQKLKGRLTFDPLRRLVAFEEFTAESAGDAAGVKGFAARASGSLRAALGSGELTAHGLAASASGTSGEQKFELSLDAPKLAFGAERVRGEEVSLKARLSRPRLELAAALALPGLEASAKAFEAPAMTLDLELKQGPQKVNVRLASPLAGSVEARRLLLSALSVRVAASGPDVPGQTIRAELEGSASVDAARESAQANLAGTLDEARMKARVGVTGFSAPSLRLDVEVDRLDLDRYFAPRAGTPTGAAGPSSPARGSAPVQQRLELSALRALRASGTVRVGSLEAANVKASNVRLEFRAAGGRLDLDPASANLYQRTLSGALAADAAAPPAFSLKRALSGVALGTLRGERVEGSGRGRGTDCTELTATFDIRDGVARKDELSMKSPLLRLAGDGEIRLPEDTPSDLVEAAIVATSRGEGGRERDALAGVTVPVRVAGPIASPSYTLEFGAMATPAAKQKVEHAVARRLEQRLRGGAAKPGGQERAQPAPRDDARRDPVRDALRGLLGR
jgi:AsmA protein